MQAKIFHNPHCSTSRRVPGRLQEPGFEVRVIEYPKTRPDHATLTVPVRRLAWECEGYCEQRKHLRSV